MRFQGPGLLLTAVILVSFSTAGKGMADPPPLAGRKYLLSVGIANYPDKPLKGCVNDAVGIQQTMVSHFGFNPNDTTLLADNDATRKKILGGLRSYADLVGRGDLFVFFFSGHGSLFPDLHSHLQDEPNDLDLSGLREQRVNLQDGRYDSALVPIDSSGGTAERPWGNLILDDELYEYFTEMTRKGAFVILVSDSCHSGTLAKSISLDERHKFIDPGVALRASIPSPRDARNDRVVPAPKADFEGRYLALTSSEDNQFSIDGPFENKPQGLFTYVLRRVISSNDSPVTYRDLHARVKAIVNATSKGSQTPFLDTRFWRGGLDTPAFTPLSTPAMPSPYAGQARLRLILKSRAGNPIAGGSMALFPRGVRTLPVEITADNTLSVLKTDQNGEAVSRPILLDSADYLVKALADGFNVFTGVVRIENIDGLATVLIVLDRQ